MATSSNIACGQAPWGIPASTHSGSAKDTGQRTAIADNTVVAEDVSFSLKAGERDAEPMDTPVSDSTLLGSSGFASGHDTSVYICNGARVQLISSSSGIIIAPPELAADVEAPCCSTGRCCRPRGPKDLLLPLEEVLCARYQPIKRHCCMLPARQRQQHHFIIHALKRHKHKPWLWSIQKVKLSGPDIDKVKSWVNYINDSIRALTDRPRQLLVFVNPYGGARKAGKIWRKVAAPIMEMGHVKCTVVTTQGPAHAQNTITSLTLSRLQQLDGIIAVGGDGLFQELMMGVFMLQQQGGQVATAAATLRLGHVPAGSTDAVAYTLNGTRDALTAALHIVLGDATAVDVAQVQYSAGGVRQCVCMASYGFMGDVVAVSEKLRWMGPLRYDVAGLLQYLCLKSYKATIWYKPAPEVLQPEDVPVSRSTTPVGCFHSCRTCSAATKVAVVPNGLAGSCIKSCAMLNVGTTPSGDDGWVCRQGRFISIKCVVTTCRSDRSQQGVVPSAHLADGRMVLVMIKNCNMLRYLHFLVLLARHGISTGMLPCVEVVAVSDVKVEPSGRQSHWNIDGELMADNSVTMHVDRGCLNVFARGIEQPAQRYQLPGR
eukprot:jgi/Chrzof1/5672/Cz16g11060.t1